MISILFIFWQTAYSQNPVKITDNLTGEGIEKFPANLIIDLDEKFKRKLFGLVSWKKDGTALGYTEFFTPVLIDPRGNKQTFDVYLPDPTEIELQPIAEKFILLTKDKEGDENYQLYQFDLESKKSIQLTSGLSTKSVNSFLWSNSGDWVYLMDADKKSNTATICSLDPQSKEIKKLAEVKGETNYLTDINGNFIVFRQFISSNETAYHLFNLKTNEISQLTSETAFYKSAKLSSASNGVWLLSNWEGNYYSLFYYDLQTKKGKKVNKTESNITGYSFSPDEKLLALKINESGSDSIRLFEMAGAEIKRELPKPVIPPGIILNFKWRNNEELGFTHETIKSPQGINIYNVRTGQAETLAKGVGNDELTSSLEDAKPIKWHSFDQKEITGFLLKPTVNEQKRKLPVLIDIHGGPKLQYQPDFNVFKSFPVSKLQIATILPNIRGSSGFGKDFESLDNREKRIDAVKDLQSLLDWIGQQPELDAGKIIVKGDSYGGLMALALALKEPIRIKAVIAESPIISIKNYIDFASTNIRELQLAEYGSSADPQFEKTESLSPLYRDNLKNWKTPVFLAVGQNDSRVPIRDAENLKEQLKANGIPVWFLTAKNEGHFWADYENRIFLNAAELYFMEKHGGF